MQAMGCISCTVCGVLDSTLLLEGATHGTGHGGAYKSYPMLKNNTRDKKTKSEEAHSSALHRAAQSTALEEDVLSRRKIQLLRDKIELHLSSLEPRDSGYNVLWLDVAGVAHLRVTRAVVNHDRGTSIGVRHVTRLCNSTCQNVRHKDKPCDAASHENNFVE